MRWALAAAVVCFAHGAQADMVDTVPPGVVGNDTGGIIMWTPDAGHVYRDLAYLHCAQYNKVAVITSVHRRYGDYAGFRCYFQRDYDPRKAYLYNGF